VTKKGEAALQAWVDQLASALTVEFDGTTDAEWVALAAAAEILERRTSTAESQLTAAVA
jgi:hypothetical protein